MGHVTFLILLRRETLSLFHCENRFTRKFHQRREPPRTSARAELEAFIEVMILSEANWARPWFPRVLASDASLSGYGVAQSFWHGPVNYHLLIGARSTKDLHFLCVWRKVSGLSIIRHSSHSAQHWHQSCPQRFGSVFSRTGTASAMSEKPKVIYIDNSLEFGKSW